MTQPPAGYWTIHMIRSYMSEIDADENPYQERIDHLWSNLLGHYFPLYRRFGIERESFVEDKSRLAANVVVTNERNGRMHKVVFVEAKPFPYYVKPYHAEGEWWHDSFNWWSVQKKLQKYMSKARKNDGNVQTMYGLVVVGDKVCFYTMRSQNNPASALLPLTLPGHVHEPLDVHDDRQEIHEILTSISNEIKTKVNTY